MQVGSFGRSLADYMTLANMLQLCASLAVDGVIAGGNTQTQANNALTALHQFGCQ